MMKVTAKNLDEIIIMSEISDIIFYKINFSQYDFS
jgi:hypothetical protein